MGDREFLIKSSQQDLLGDNQGIRLNCAATTSVHQLSEHGMQIIQGQFPRLKVPVQFEEFGERKGILHFMVVLYNCQTGQVGISRTLSCQRQKLSFLQLCVVQNSELVAW